MAIAQPKLPQNPSTKKEEIFYPESDGQPMGETGIHAKTTFHLYGALMSLLRSRGAEAYVAADMFLYYEEGNPKAVKAPDVMVIKGVDGSYERRTFKLWEEKAAPTVIFEITSKSTQIEDLVTKSALYASLGVKEYFIFDPLEEYLEETLQGFRLKGGMYEVIDPDDEGSLISEELEVSMHREGILLRLIDLQTGEKVLSLDEPYIKAREEAQRAEQEAQRAEQEAQRAEQEAQRAEQEAQRAEQEAQRAEQEAQRAEQEAQRAAAAEEEVERLRAQLAKLTGRDGESE